MTGVWVAEQAMRLPQTRLVCVADRESDIMALLVRARELNHAADYLVLSQHNRALPEIGKLWEKVSQAPVLGCVRFELPAGRGRKICRWIWCSRPTSGRLRSSGTRSPCRRRCPSSTRSSG